MMNGRVIHEALSPVLFMLACVGVIAIAHHACGCRGAANPRAQARAVVLEMAEGVKMADKACADLARAKRDADLARGCDKARDEAKLSLEAAESALDAEQADDARCQFASALASATKLAELIEGAGGKLPNVFRDAFELAPALAGGCRG